MTIINVAKVKLFSTQYSFGLQICQKKIMFVRFLAPIAKTCFSLNNIHLEELKNLNLCELYFFNYTYV